MGLMGRIFGGGLTRAGAAVGGVAEVFVGNRAERDAAASAQLQAAMGEFAAEFGAATGRFDGFVNGLMQPSRDMLVRAVTPDGQFGKVFGFVTTGFNIGGIIAPLIFG